MNAVSKAVALSLVLASAGCMVTHHRFVSQVAAPKPQTAEEKGEGELNELCEKGEWEKAAKMCSRLFAKCRDDRALVLRGTQLAILNWNCGNRMGAVIAMDTVITACSRLGAGRDAAALRFRNDLRKGRVNGKFTVEEAVYLVGIRKAIADEALR